MGRTKIKKTMLITGLATAMNLGAGFDNGGYAMIKEQTEHQDNCLRTIIYNSSHMTIDVLNEKLELLDDIGQPSPFYNTEYLRYLLTSTASSLTCADSFMTPNEVSKYSQFVNLVTTNLEHINRRHWQYLGETLEQIKEDTCN